MPIKSNIKPNEGLTRPAKGKKPSPPIQSLLIRSLPLPLPTSSYICHSELFIVRLMTLNILLQYDTGPAF